MLQETDPEDPPDLVIAADTVVVRDEEIMEKPLNPIDHARMIGELNDGTVSSFVCGSRRDDIVG